MQTESVILPVLLVQINTYHIPKQKVAMYVGSTAGESSVAKGAKEAGFRIRRLFVLKNTTYNKVLIFTCSKVLTNWRTTYSSILYFLKFLSSAESQLYWAQQTGYMPPIASVLEQDAYKNSGSKVPKILADATKNLFSIPVVENLILHTRSSYDFRKSSRL